MAAYESQANETVIDWKDDSFWVCEGASSEVDQIGVDNGRGAFEDALIHLDPGPNETDQEVMATVARGAICARLRERHQEDRRFDRLFWVVRLIILALAVVFVAVEWGGAGTVLLAFLGMVFPSVGGLQVLPGWGKRWQYWAATLVLLAVASVVAVLLAPDPGVVGAFFVGVGLGAAIFVVDGLVATALMTPVERAVRLVRGGAEPWPRLVSALLDTYWEAHTWMGSELTDYREAKLWSIDRRRRIAAALEPAAARVARDADTTPRLRRKFAPETRDLLRNRGQRIAAWLRQAECDILWPSRKAELEYQAKIAHGLAAACLGNWSELEADPPPQRARRWLRRMVPRVAVVAALIAAAVFLPGQLDIDTEAQSDVRTILILAAVAALAGAGESIPDAVQKLQGQLVKDDA
jgi:hypothetical protein